MKTATDKIHQIIVCNTLKVTRQGLAFRTKSMNQQLVELERMAGGAIGCRWRALINFGQKDIRFLETM